MVPIVLLVLGLSSAGVAAPPGWEPITRGPGVWSDPTIGGDGSILALDHAGGDRGLVVFASDCPGERDRPSHPVGLAGVASGSTAEVPVAIRRGRVWKIPVETDSLVRLDLGTGSQDVFFQAEVGERLADAEISPDRHWIAVVARREPRARGEVVSSRVLMVSAIDGSSREVEGGAGDRWGPSFTANGAVLLWVRGEGEYSMLARGELGGDGRLAGAPRIVHRDRARWGRPVPVDADARQVVVSRDSGRGQALWRVDVGTAVAQSLTPSGRAAFAPALSGSGRELVFVGVGGGGVNLFRTSLEADDRDDGLAAKGSPPPAPRASEALPGDLDPRLFGDQRARALDESCRGCHGHERGLMDLASSVHQKFACIDCHVDVTETPHRSILKSELVETSGDDERGRPLNGDGSPRVEVGAGLRGGGVAVAHFTAASLSCGGCHGKAAAAYASDSHGRAFDALRADAPGCPSCHGDHAIRPRHDEGSPVSSASMVTTCGKTCHEGTWLVVHDAGAPAGSASRSYLSDPVDTYLDSIHAKKVRLGHEGAATCASCHGAHGVRPPTDPASTLAAARIGETCAANGACHVGADSAFARSFDHELPEPGRWDARRVVELSFWLLGGLTVVWTIGDLTGDALRRVLGRWRRGRATP